MELSEINLNLLLLLGIILQEKNTTRTAERLKLSQPAVSKGLKKLRVIFDDELLVWSSDSRNAALTQKASSLKNDIKEMIELTEQLYGVEKEFIPYLSTRHFKIAMFGHMPLYLHNELSRLFMKYAPKSAFSTLNIEQDHEHDIVQMDEIDLIVTRTPVNSKLFKSENLPVSKLVCLIAKEEASLGYESISLEELRELRHVLITSGNDSIAKEMGNSSYKQLYKSMEGLKIIETPFLSSAMNLVEKGSCIILCPETTAKKVQEDYAIRYLPLKKSFYTSHIMYWSKKKDALLYHKWLRKIFKEAYNITFHFKE